MKKLDEIAKKLDIPSSWLNDLINFESNWNPFAKNPNSSARGLLQFTDQTARGLGYRNSLDLVNSNMTIERQLQFAVLPYLLKYYPYTNFQSLAMSVFYPIYKNKPDWTTFPSHVKKVNPGINKISDYLKKVYFHNNKYYISNIEKILVISGGFYLWQKRKKLMKRN